MHVVHEGEPGDKIVLTPGQTSDRRTGIEIEVLRSGTFRWQATASASASSRTE
jgi:hypothetical protein